MKISNPLKRLTKFELCLWLGSIIIITVSFLLPAEKDVLTLLASLIGVTALIFVAKGMPIGQFLGVIFALFYGIVALIFKYYGEIITYLGMSAPSALVSFIVWLKNPYKNSEEVKVEKLKTYQKIIVAISSVVVTLAFYFILKALHTPNLIVSVISVTTSITASLLTIFRSPFYAVCYAFNDIVLIVL